MTILNCGVPNHISGTAEARVAKFCAQLDTLSINIRITHYPLNITGNVKDRYFKFCILVGHMKC